MAVGRNDGRALLYDLVEHDIRDIKVALDTENLRSQSVEMMKKELLTSIVAYNLVVQFRRQAASLAGVLPRRLSFTRVWGTFSSSLLRYGRNDGGSFSRKRKPGHGRGDPWNPACIPLMS